MTYLELEPWAMHLSENGKTTNFLWSPMNVNFQNWCFLHIFPTPNYPCEESWLSGTWYILIEQIIAMRIPPHILCFSNYSTFFLLMSCQFLCQVPVSLLARGWEWTIPDFNQEEYVRIILFALSKRRWTLSFLSLVRDYRIWYRDHRESTVLAPKSIMILWSLIPFRTNKKNDNVHHFLRSVKSFSKYVFHTK